MLAKPLAKLKAVLRIRSKHDKARIAQHEKPASAPPLACDCVASSFALEDTDSALSLASAAASEGSAAASEGSQQLHSGSDNEARDVEGDADIDDDENEIYYDALEGCAPADSEAPSACRGCTSSAAAQTALPFGPTAPDSSARKPPATLFEMASAQRVCPYEPGTDGTPPESVQRIADAFLQAHAERRVDPTPWGKPAKAHGGVTCHSRPRPGTRSLEFLTQATFTGIRADALWHSFLYENRISWDPAVSSVSYLRRYARRVDDTPSAADSPAAEGGYKAIDVVTYTTKPAAGGLISGRAFMDMRHTHRSCHVVSGDESSPEPPLVRYASASVGGQWGEDVESLTACGLLDEIGAREYLELVKEARLVRGFNLPGGGLAVEERIDDETGERCVDVIALSSTEIGGRVPTSVVNSATAGAMVAVFVGLGKALERQHPGTEICPHINGRGTS